MSHNYTVNTRINRPVADVFKAIVSGETIIKYFVNGTSGDLLEGEQVVWRWDHWGENPVFVKTIKENELIELTLNSLNWQKTKEDSYDVLVSFVFEILDEGGTMLSISESGWRTDEEGLKGSHDNCGGWTHMAMCLKAYLEHDIDLR